MIWLVFIVMTGFAVLSVTIPLAFARGESMDEPSDPYICKAQMEQKSLCGWLRVEKTEGLEFEAERLILIARQRQGRSSRLPATIAAVVASVFIPLLSWLLYLQLGRSDMPDQPLAARIEAIPGHKNSFATIDQVEAYLRQHPNNGNAYEFVAPFYLRAQRPQDAVRALTEALRLLGPSAPRLAALGEAKVITAGGTVTQEAKHNFEDALARDATSLTSRYYLGLAARQTQDEESAIAIWSRLLADASPNERWIGRMRDQLDELLRASRDGGAGGRVKPR